MSGGSFCRCPACDKLNILGATCVCGQRTDLPAAWPCANYERPVTCLIASSSKTGRCDRCKEAALD